MVTVWNGDWQRAAPRSPFCGAFDRKPGDTASYKSGFLSPTPYHSICNDFNLGFVLQDWRWSCKLLVVGFTPIVWLPSVLTCRTASTWSSRLAWRSTYSSFVPTTMALIFEKSYIALSTVVKYISKYASLTPRPLVCCQQIICEALSDFLQDISDNVVLQGKHYIAIGEHSDLWEGKISDKKVRCRKSLLKLFITVLPLQGCGEGSTWRLLQQPWLSTKIQRGE